MTRVENLNKSTKWTDPTNGQDYSPQSGRTPQTVKTTVHKVDEPNNKGRKFKQVHEMDENKSTKWTDLTKGQDYSPQCGRTQ